MDSKLTPKQQRFIEEYLKDLNATQAAIRAGYSERTARTIGHDLLTKPYISNAIEEAKLKRSKRTQIDADYVLSRLVEIDQMDVADILDNEGNLLPVNQWPKVWRTTLSGMDIQRLKALGGDGDERQIESVLQKIKWPDKVKNLELLGKHVSVQAFKDRMSHEGAVVDEMADLMKQISDDATS